MKVEKLITLSVVFLAFLSGYGTYRAYQTYLNYGSRAIHHTFEPEGQQTYCQAVKEASEVDLQAFFCAPELHEDFKKTAWGKAAIQKFPGLATADCKTVAEITEFEVLKRASDEFLKKCQSSATSTAWKTIDFRWITLE